MIKYKIGDKVRLVNTSFTFNGAVGVVKRIAGRRIHVSVQEKRSVFGDGTWTCFSNEIELVNKNLIGGKIL